MQLSLSWYYEVFAEMKQSHILSEAALHNHSAIYSSKPDGALS